MIVLGTFLTLAIFLVVGWAVSVEMFQHRAWRRRVGEGDVAIVHALIEEAMSTWRRSRPPRGLAASLWAGVQGAQVVAITAESVTVSAAAEAEFRTEEGARVQVASALDEAIALAARLVDMLLYDVPNLRLGTVRVDVYTTFTAGAGGPVQRAILSTRADRADADELLWEALTPAEVLGRFETVFERGPGGQGLPIEVAPLEGVDPRTIVHPPVAEDA